MRLFAAVSTMESVLPLILVRVLLGGKALIARFLFVHKLVLITEIAQVPTSVLVREDGLVMTALLLYVLKSVRIRAGVLLQIRASATSGPMILEMGELPGVDHCTKMTPALP